MRNLQLASRLKSIIPENHQPRIVAALIQDPFIWNSLQHPPFLERVNYALKEYPDSWSPAAVGLVSLNLLPDLVIYKSKPLPPLEKELRQKAAKVFENFSKGQMTLFDPADKIFTQPDFISSDVLPNASLLALALRERYRLLGTWEGLKNELEGFADLHLLAWKTPIACLMGLIPDPLDFLIELTSNANSYEPLSLAVHGLLSLPLTNDDQLKIVQKLLESILPGNQRVLLDLLALRKPALACKAAAWLATQNMHCAKDFLDEPGMHDLEQLIALTHYAEVYRSANQIGQALRLFDQALRIIRYLQAEFSARWASTAAKAINDPSLPSLLHQTDLLTAWKNAQSFENETQTLELTSPYQVSVSLTLIQAGDAGEIHRWLSIIDQRKTPDENPIPHAISIALIRHLMMTGDFARARRLAVETINEVLLPQNVEPIPEWVSNLYGIESNTRLELLLSLPDLLNPLHLIDQEIAILDLALTVRSSDPELYTLLGQAYQTAGNSEKAIQTFETALLLDPDSLVIRRALAANLERCGQYEAALEQREFIYARTNGHQEKTDISIEDALNLAACALEVGKAQRVREVCQEVLEQDGSNWKAHLLFGKAQFYEQDLANTLSSFQLASQLAPDEPEPWLEMATLFISLNQKEQATAILQTAVQAAPQSAKIHLELGKLLMAENALTAAEPSLRNAYTLTQPRDSQPFYPTQDAVFFQAADCLGETLRRLGHLTQSKEVLESAIAQIEDAKPENYIQLIYNYAQTLLGLGENESALPILAEVVSTHPASVQPYFEYGKTLLQTNGDAGEAIRALSTAHEVDPENPETLVFLAEAYMAGKQYPQATQAFLQAMETDLFRQKPWQERICFGLGKSALAQGLLEQAIAALQDANHANPRNPEIYRTLAEACWASNLHVDAWSAAKSALHLDPQNKTALAWFADHVIGLFTQEDQSSPPGGPNIKRSEFSPAQIASHLHPSQLVQEAIEAFTAFQPVDRLPSAMLVRLGWLHFLAGNGDLASETLQRVIHSENPTTFELKTAAEILFRLGDISGVILALEHALSQVENSEEKEPIAAIQKDLARAYFADRNFSAAKHSLEIALQIRAEDEALYHNLAAIEILSGNPERGLEILKQGLVFCQQLSSQVIFHYYIAKLNQHLKRYGAALDHVDAALGIPARSDFHGKLPVSEFELRNLGAELSLLSLDPQSAERYLLNLPESDPADCSASTSSQIACYCSLAEIALDRQEPADALKYLQIAQQCASQESHISPRLLAAQARLLLRKKGEAEALLTFEDCLKELRNHEEAPETSADLRNIPVWEPNGAIDFHRVLPEQKTFEFLGAIDAAIELRQWKAAQSIAHQVLHVEPEQPVLLLAYARLLTEMQETSNLYHELEIIQHLPEFLPTETAPLPALLEAVHSAEKLLWQAISTRSKKSSPQPGFNLIARWKCRGQAAYDQEVNPEYWLSLPLGPEDIAAAISATRRASAASWDMGLFSKNLTYSDPNIQLQQALSLRQHDPEGALKVAADLAKKSVDSTPATEIAIRQALLAYTAYQAGKYQIARDAIHLALTIWSDEPRWHALAGELWLRDPSATGSKPDLQEAIRHLETAVQLEPEYLSHHLLLAEAFTLTSENQAAGLHQAIRILERATQRIPNHPELLIQLAKYHSRLQTQSDLTQAARYIDNALDALRNQPGYEDNPEPQLLKAEIALRLNDPQEAYRLASAVRHAHPLNPDALLIQVRALENSKRAEDALYELEYAQEIVANSKSLQLKRAFLYGKCKGQQAELEELRILARQYPEDIVILNALVESLTRAGSLDEAIQAAQTALQNAASDAQALQKANLHYLLGELLSRIGQLDQAIHHLTQTLKYHPQYVEAYLTLGSVYQKQRQHKKAQKIFQQAIQAAPYDVRPYLQAAISYKEGKDYQKAEELLRKAVELAPQDVAIRKQLAAIVAINLVQNPNPIHIHPPR